jgi:uncharacterized protein
MTREIISRGSVEFLKKEAKKWLKSLETGDTDAMARLKRALPLHDADNAKQPTLRTVQHALAREHGVEGWFALTGAIETRARELREIAAEILRHAIFKGDPAVAARLYGSHAEIATLDLFTAVAAGNLAEVNRRLAADPSAASRAGGPLNWPPLLYLTYMRLPGSATQSVEIARALLDRGADANSSWNDGSSNVAFKALTGVIALGEGVQPTHERADELVDLLIEQGADPCDSHAFYNTSIFEDDVHWLDVLWSHSERRGVTNTWREVSKQRIGGHRGMSPIDFMLSLAVSRNHLQRAEWLLEHGANANGVHADSGRRLRNEALMNGHDAMAALLLRQGAADEPLQLHGIVAFQVACRRLDRNEARRLSQLHPEFLRDSEVVLTAVLRSRPDVIELLLELGMDVDLETVAGFPALHSAVAADAIDIVKVLIAHGADIDRPADNYGGAMGISANFARHEIAKVLAPLSRDVHSMVRLAMKDRLRELFTAEPELADLVHFRSGQTPLFFLPDEEAPALDMAKFLLEHGAGVRFVNKEGDTAANAARKRGFNEVAQLLTDAMKRR